MLCRLHSAFSDETAGPCLAQILRLAGLAVRSDADAAPLAGQLVKPHLMAAITLRMLPFDDDLQVRYPIGCNQALFICLAFWGFALCFVGVLCVC